MPVHPQVRQLLDAMALMDGPPLIEMEPDAARAMYANMTMVAGAEDVAGVEDREVPGPGGNIPVRIYTPEQAVAHDAALVVWLHGGGWVIGDLDTADATARALANRSGAVVVSVGYRLAPEHRAPAALDDAQAVLVWVVEHEELLGVDARRVAVGGDSAGGNLAAALCQRMRDEGGPAIAFQLLVYPVVDCTLSHPSMDEHAEGYSLTRDIMGWFVDHYLNGADPTDPSVSPLRAPSLAGLPPALVITAEFDPLRDEGEAYAAALRDAGVIVEAVRYDGQIHGFMGMASLLDDGQHALDRAGSALRAALS